MHLPPLLPATLLRRYKRFLCDVRLTDGRRVVAHCPNSGTMLTCERPGCPALVSESANPHRKLRYTLELTKPGAAWICVNTMRPNHVVREAVEQGRVPELAGYAEVRSEVPYGKASRVDLRLSGPGRPTAWVEVKNTTLRSGVHAAFPDAVTERGAKHLAELERVVRRGDRGVMFYLVNRADCGRFRPADEVDPEYGRLLRRAVRRGVEVLAYRSVIRGRTIRVGARLPADL